MSDASAMLRAVNPFRQRFLLLLVILFLEFMLYPVLREARILGAHLFSVFTVLVLLAAVYAVANRKGVRKGVTALATLLLVLQLADGWADSERLSYAILVLYIIFSIYIGLVLLSFALGQGPVTADKIYSAVSVYLLIGFIFAMVYVLMEKWAPGSFAISERFTSHSTGSGQGGDAMGVFFYFSFVTLTTLGYGDITPVSPLAASFCGAEAIMGQIFIAVLLARLVALHTAHSKPTA